MKVLTLSQLKVDYHEPMTSRSRNSRTIFTDGHLNIMVQFCQNLLCMCTKGTNNNNKMSVVMVSSYSVVRVDKTPVPE